MSQVLALGLKKECKSEDVVLKGEKQQAGRLEEETLLKGPEVPRGEGETRCVGRRGGMPMSLITPSETKRRTTNRVGSGRRILDCTEDPSRGDPFGVELARK